MKKSDHFLKSALAAKADEAASAEASIDSMRGLATANLTQLETLKAEQLAYLGKVRDQKLNDLNNQISQVHRDFTQDEANINLLFDQLTKREERAIDAFNDFLNKEVKGMDDKLSRGAKGQIIDKTEEWEMRHGGTDDEHNTGKKLKVVSGTAD